MRMSISITTRPSRISLIVELSNSPENPCDLATLVRADNWRMKTATQNPKATKKAAIKIDRIVPVAKSARARKAAVRATQKRERSRELTICLCGTAGSSAADKSIAYTDHGFDAVTARI